MHDIIKFINVIIKAMLQRQFVTYMHVLFAHYNCVLILVYAIFSVVSSISLQMLEVAFTVIDA